MRIRQQTGNASPNLFTQINQATQRVFTSFNLTSSNQADTNQPTSTPDASDTSNDEVTVLDPRDNARDNVNDDTDRGTPVGGGSSSGGGGGDNSGNPPNASFAYTTTNLSADFTNQSSDPDNDIANYEWSFGDYTKSSKASPTHTFQPYGTSTATLTVTDESGNTDSITKHLSLSYEPIASEGTIKALGWHDPEGNTGHITGLMRFSDIVGHDDSDPSSIASTSQQRADGTRILFTQNSFGYLIQGGWVDHNENDNAWMTTLTENVSNEDRSAISVSSTPYSLSEDKKIFIQTGDPSNPPLDSSNYITAYTSSSTNQGAGSLPIDDGNGSGVSITASSGDRILVDHQSLWLDHSTEKLKLAWQNWLQTFVDNSGVADGVTMDTESGGIPDNKYIRNDPRWDDPAEGFNGTSFKTMVSNGTNYGSEIAKQVLVNGWEEAIVSPLEAKFPNAVSSQYNYNGMSQSQAGVAPNQDGKRIWGSRVGTHGNQPQYASMRNITRGSEPDDFDDAGSIHDAPFRLVQYETNRARTLHRANNGNIQPWLTYHSLSDNFYHVDVRGEGTPYYLEYLYHVIMATDDTDAPFFYFNPNPATKENPSDLIIAEDEAVDYTIDRLIDKTNGGSWQLAEDTNVSYADRVIATPVDDGQKRLWRVTVNRINPQDDRAITVNVSNGDTITIPAGEVGTWYETSVSEFPTFSYQHPPVDNELPNDSWLNITSSNYFAANDTSSATSSRPDPNGGNNAYLIESSGQLNYWSKPIPVEPNTSYTLSMWIKRVSNLPSIEVYAGDSGTSTNNRLASHDARSTSQDEWTRVPLRFQTDGSGYIRIRWDQAHRDLGVYRPMLNQGEWKGPWEKPSAN